MTGSARSEAIARVREAVGALGNRSPNDWRTLWSQVRTEYRAAFTDDLSTIATYTGLTNPTLTASVTALLDGLDPQTLCSAPSDKSQVTLVILAASVPALAAQPLFPLLAAGSAVIFKPSAREPDSAELLVEVLTRLDPEVSAAVSLQPELRFGEGEVDASGFDRVIAYGHDDTLASIACSLRRSDSATALSPQGHGFSAVYLAAESICEEELDAVARDVALFDQRGCLCPQVLFTSAPADEVVTGLGEALARVAEELPPGLDTAMQASLRNLRDTTVAAGRRVSAVSIDAGLAFERDPTQPLEETLGGRSVRVFGRCSIPDAIDLLRPVRNRLQSLGVAVPEASRRRAHAALASLRTSRIVRPGELHSPGFDWVARQLGLSGPC